jgi:hypothetical protein
LYNRAKSAPKNWLAAAKQAHTATAANSPGLADQSSIPTQASKNSSKHANKAAWLGQ